MRRAVLAFSAFLVNGGMDAAVWAQGEHPAARPGPGFVLDSQWPGAAEASIAEFEGSVSGLDIDRAGHIWILARSTVPVQVRDAHGTLVRSWGAGIFQKPHGLGFDADGRVWIADAGDHTVRLFTPEGELLRTLGVAGEAGSDPQHFDQPTDVAVGPDGSIYVSDGYGNNRVVRFDRDGRFLNAFGSEGKGPGQFRLPHALVFDAQGRLYVADRSNGRIQVFDAQGGFLAEWPNQMMPWDLWVSPRTGTIFACGSSPMGPGLGLKLLPAGIPPRDQLVVEFDSNGKPLNRWPFPQGSQPGSVSWVHALARTPEGALHLGDIQGKRAQRFLPRDRRVDSDVERASATQESAPPAPAGSR